MTESKYLAAQYLDDEPGALPEELQGWPEYDIDDDWVEDDPENDLIDERLPDALIRTIKLTPVTDCEALKKENARLRAQIKLAQEMYPFLRDDDDWVWDGEL